MFTFYYRIVRYLNRYYTFTPEYQKKVSIEEFIQAATRYENYPYVLGAEGGSRSDGIDCSHLIAKALIDTGAMSPYFYRQARYLVNLSKAVHEPHEMQRGDLLLLSDDTGIFHVAIITEVRSAQHLQIFDASGPNTGIYSTIFRDIDLADIDAYTIRRLHCLRY